MTPRILIIEDDPAIVELLSDMLGEQYEVSWGNDGAGMIMAITNPPALIILDVMMHPVDGERVLLHLRADPGTAEVPVIILSAKPDAALLAARYAHTTFSSKPFENAVFMKLVLDALGS